MMKALFLLISLAVLAGCENKLPVVERQTFIIQAERPGGAAREARAGALRMGVVAVASPFDERALVYRRDDVRYEIDSYNQFAADPAEMVAEAAAGWISLSGLFRQVLPPGTAAPTDFRLEASVSALYVDFQDNPPAAVLNMRWQVFRERDGSSVLDLDCRQRVGLAERSPSGAARAYREALRQALAKLETALAEAGL